MKRSLFSRRPSPAMVVALTALVSSLTGVAAGAALIDSGDIKDGSITKKDLHKNSVNTKKVDNKSLKANDFAPGELKNGVQGIQGLQGPKGAPGEDGADGADGADATALWAVINGDTGATFRGSHVTSSTRNGNGSYTVTFDRNVASCAFMATIGGNDLTQPNASTGTARSPSDVNAVNVATFAGGGFADADVSLAVFC
jgi:hypothetical protein